MGKTLDRTRHHITVHGREESGQRAAYMQDGVYFDGDGVAIPATEVHPSGKAPTERARAGKDEKSGKEKESTQSQVEAQLAA